MPISKQQSFADPLLVCGVWRSRDVGSPSTPLGPILSHMLSLSDLGFSHVPSDAFYIVVNRRVA